MIYNYEQFFLISSIGTTFQNISSKFIAIYNELSKVTGTSNKLFNKDMHNEEIQGEL